jgi:hypothetical protein
MDTEYWAQNRYMFQEWCLLGCYAMWLVLEPTFRRNSAPPSSGWQETDVFLHSVCWLLVTASIVPSSPILVTLMKQALSSSETLVLTRATRRNIPEDPILHSHLPKNLKSYTGTRFICLHSSLQNILKLWLTDWRLSSDVRRRTCWLHVNWPLTPI